MVGRSWIVKSPTRLDVPRPGFVKAYEAVSTAVDSESLHEGFPISIRPPLYLVILSLSVIQRIR
jgi:hypothetical protein